MLRCCRVIMLFHAAIDYLRRFSFFRRHAAAAYDVLRVTRERCFYFA